MTSWSVAASGTRAFFNIAQRRRDVVFRVSGVDRGNGRLRTSTEIYHTDTTGDAVKFNIVRRVFLGPRKLSH